MPPPCPTDRVPSGLDALDGAWGGLCRGAAHLLYGRAASGRDLLALRLAQGAVEAGETCVLVTGRDPRDLVALSGPIGFDVEGAAREGRLRLLRVPPDLGAAGDDGLAASLADLGRIAAKAAPDRLVVEDFTPFVRFREFSRLRAAVLSFLESLQSGGITTVLALGEPANVHSREIVGFLRGQVAGALHIAEDPARPGASARLLTLLPPPARGGDARTVAWDPRAPSAPPSSHEDAPPDLVVPHDAPPSGEAPISFFDLHDPFAAPTPAEDPFARPGPGWEFEGGRFVAGEAPPPEPPPPAQPPPPSPEGDWTELLLRNAFYLGEEAAPEAPAPLPPWEDLSALEGPSEREAFAKAFDAALRRRAEERTPFLALALRLSPPGTEHVDTIAWGLRETIGEGDALLADTDRGRIALLLPGRGAEAGQGTIRRLRQLLRESGEAGAEAQLRAAAALVVPDGRPFQSGEAFLAYAVDGD